MGVAESDGGGVGAAVAEPGDGDVDREDDEGGTDEALADGIKARRDGEMEGDDADPEGGDGEGVAEGVEQAEAHAFAPVALNAGDVGDGGEMVVVKAMAQAEQSAGEEGELERVRHGGVRHGTEQGYGADGRVANGETRPRE